MTGADLATFARECREYLIPGAVGIAGWLWKRARAERRFRARLETALKELRPNGGSSLRDVVDQIAKRLEHLEEGQAYLSRTVEANRALQTAYMSLATGEHQALFHADAEGNCVWVDATFIHWTGRSLAQVEGYGWISMIAETDRERVIEQWRMSVGHGADFRCEYLLLRYDGARLPVVGRAIAMHGPKRELVGYLGTIEQRVT